jgi:hypothetical protein
LYEKFLRNQIQELKGNIRVFCRIRPVITKIDGNDDLAAKEGVKEVIRVQGMHEVEVCSSSLGFSSAGQKVFYYIFHQ